MKKLTMSDYRCMPWKNGAGTTVEIAVFPAHAKLDDFSWRVSRAQVASDGPFSSFPHIDRSLALLNGAGVRLTVDAELKSVDGENNIVTFAGDANITAQLIEAPIDDLNVMTRREVCSHQLIHWTGKATRQLFADTVLLYCAQGAGKLLTDSVDLDLTSDEAVQFSTESKASSCVLQSDADSRFYCVRITPLLPSPQWDSLWINVHLATMAEDGGYGECRDGAIAVKDGVIAWLGKKSSLPQHYRSTRVVDGQGAWLTPGLIDCHTHIVYAGNRSNEFEDRLNGVSYEEIAKRGGGIVSTVTATRAASEAELLAQSRIRVERLLQEGVTTLECKSGYGLDLATEAKILRVARQLGEQFSVRICTTFLGAHAVPPEYAGHADAYVDLVCEHMLPSLVAEELVDAVDAFCEKIGFTPAQTERVFEAARKCDKPVKLHAEQLSDQGGAALTARYQGLSADHLEYLSEEGIAAMSSAGTVAVLLPGAYYFLRETQLPPLAALRKAAVPIAIATDCNPGTSPMTSLLLVMNMACTLFRMTPLEALQGTTRHAAKALGLHHQIGSLEVGKRADFALWQVERPADLSYAIGANPCCGVVFGGIQVSVDRGRKIV